MAKKIIDVLLEQAIAENPEKLKEAEADVNLIYALGMGDFRFFQSLVPLMRIDGVTEEGIIENAFFAGIIAGTKMFGDNDGED